MFKKRLLALFALVFTALLIQPAIASAFLHVDAAYSRGKTHVSNYDCPNFGYCYAYPAALKYDRRSDTRVLVLIRMYSNSRGACDSWFDIRGSDTNSTLEHYGLWVC